MSTPTTTDRVIRPDRTTRPEHPAKRFRSLKSRLALTYVALALMTAAILGAGMLLVLGSYYHRAETAYLRAAVQRVLRTPPGQDGAGGYAAWAQVAALDAQTRVRLVGPGGQVIADSGAPDRIDARRLEMRDGGGHGPGRQQGGMPGPLGGGIFGHHGYGDPRSSASLTVPVTGSDLPAGTTLVLSEGPLSGRGVLLGVSEAWLVAALLAVALAVLVGWLVAARFARPIGALTEASDRMAAGDLGVRADVRRDDEVGRLAESFNEMAGRTETTVMALRRFVGDAAHELGTPLTALQADLELAEARTESADERRLIQLALAQAYRLQALSGDLLRLSRLEAGGRTADPERIDLNRTAHQAADAVASRAEQAELTLALEIATEALPVVADEGELQGAVANLLDNAVKFTPAGGTITLGTRRDGAHAFLWVADTGVGIPAEEQSQVFERFHRGRTTAAVPGSGLGLAIVKATVERCGGTVALRSDEGAGTTVELRLPNAG